MSDVRHVIVEVRGGALVDTKAAILPGTALSIGRDVPSGFLIPGDASLSVTHFSVRWDGKQCLLRDLKSVRGTTLNGDPVEGDVEVSSGDWVRAGDTDFVIYFEGETPPPEEEDDDNQGEDDEETEQARRDRQTAREERNGRAAAALTTLQRIAAEQPLFAILDGARSPRIVELLHENIDEYRSLYDGTEGETMADVAPYLVRFAASSRLLQALVSEGWERRWSIYVTSSLPLRDVRRHFRRFLMVELEDSGERLYFRYYDPWVLGVFWPAATFQQKDDFLRELTGLYIEKQGALERLLLDEMREQNHG